MDDPGLDPRLRHQALRGLARVNRITRTGARIWREIRQRLALSGETIRIADLACGGGDVAIDLSLRAQRDGCRVEIVGFDFNAVTLDYARASAAARRATVAFECRDLLAEQLPGEFDVACCSLFLHHLPDEAAASFLAAACRHVKRLLVISDLQRTRTGYLLAWCGTRLFSRSPVVRNDGLLSVRAAFTCEEVTALAHRAGLAESTLQTHFPERFLLTWQPP